MAERRRALPPYFAVSTRWPDSPMFEGATAAHRLAWFCLLTECKIHGRKGVVEFPQKRMARKYDVSIRGVEDMIKNALEDEAIEVDGDIITICNFQDYQYGTQKKAAFQSRGKQKSRQNRTTLQTSHINHQNKKASTTSCAEWPAILAALESWKGQPLNFTEAEDQRWSRLLMVIENGAEQEPIIVHGETVQPIDMMLAAIKDAMARGLEYRSAPESSSLIRKNVNRAIENAIWPNEKPGAVTEKQSREQVEDAISDDGDDGDTLGWVQECIGDDQ